MIGGVDPLCKVLYKSLDMVTAGPAHLGRVNHTCVGLKTKHFHEESVLCACQELEKLNK